MLEADFTRYYQTDLRAACWGAQRWGVRRLKTHIGGLPRESAFARSRRGDSADWSQDTELLAGISDALQFHNYMYLRAHGERVDLPDRFPRPDSPSVEPERGMSLAEFNAFLKE